MLREMFLLLIFTFSTSIRFPLVFSQDILVETPSGPIEGEVISQGGILLKRFLGIPYVKPPINNLRFRKPVPIEPWNTTLVAKRMGPACVQYSPTSFPWTDDLPGKSEDCLYLNIWAPLEADCMNKKSVMFWIHGGGFTVGSSRIEYHHGLTLAAVGDVIVVTTNYRLGPQGFLYSGTEDAPGNMGLLDMVEALKWVRGNIEHFGGDKDSITLFGHSSGGIAIGMFCVSPVTRGLFKRAIMQSGSPTNLEGQDNDMDFRVSQELAEAVGCADDENTLSNNPGAVVECLRCVDGFKLSKTLSIITKDSSGSLYPRFGDSLLPKDPRQSVIDGDFAAVDLLIGSNTGEGGPLITILMKDVFGTFGEKYPQINITFGESIIRKKFKNFPDPDAVVRQYFSGIQESDYYNIRFQVFTASGDYARTCPSVYFAESFARKGAPTYYYFQTRRPCYTPWAPWMLSVHFDEVPFMLGYALRHREKFTEAEIMLSTRMMRAWSSFAKTGIPSYGVWPRYSRDYPDYQVLDVYTLGTALGPHRSNCDFFRSYFGF